MLRGKLNKTLSAENQALFKDEKQQDMCIPSRNVALYYPIFAKVRGFSNRFVTNLTFSLSLKQDVSFYV